MTRCDGGARKGGRSRAHDGGAAMVAPPPSSPWGAVVRRHARPARAGEIRAMTITLPLPLQFALLLFAGWINRQQLEVIAYLREENRVLKAHAPGRLRLTDAERRRLAVKAQRLGRKLLGEVGCLFTPDTILRWYRRLVAAKYDGSARRRPGRPRKPAEVADLVVRVAGENPGFGYTRIRDALSNLGLAVSRSTVKRILEERGLEPAPERGRRPSWKTFLTAHWGAIAAGDFFTVEVLTWRGIVRYQVFFLIDLASRRVEIAGLAPDPSAAWLKQLTRTLLDSETGFLRGKRKLILDRDPLFASDFRELLAAGGVDVVRLPRASPNLNAYAERFVRTVRDECLSQLVPLGEAHLRRALREFVAHYHAERHHQGLGSALIEPDATANRTTGRVACRVRLGGLVRYYHRAA